MKFQRGWMPIADSILVSRRQPDDRFHLHRRDPMRSKLTLDLDLLTVDSFPTTRLPAANAYEAASPIRKPTSGPCLNSEQTCDPRCIA
jgi:hypothetical protein